MCPPDLIKVSIKTVCMCGVILACITSPQGLTAIIISSNKIRDESTQKKFRAYNE